MRITPSHPRLRIIAVASFALGGWSLLQPGQIAASGHSPLLAVTISLAAIFFLAIGVAFWMLGTDRRAGIIFDSKGLMLNLGHSAAFVSWQNIADTGVSRRRSSILALGSSAQIGIRLHDPLEYLQSYEARLPASRSLIACAIRLVRRVVSRLGRQLLAPSLEQIEALRSATGYDLLIPEVLLGGQADGFIGLIDTYRHNPSSRRSLQIYHTARGM
jgi:hypothetical protein